MTESIISTDSFNLFNQENQLKEFLVQTIVNNIQEGIGIVDENEVIQFCNPAFARIFEMPLQQLVGKNLLSFFEDSTKQIIYEQTQRRRKGESSEYEIPIKTALGNHRWLHVSISPRFGLQGEYNGAFGVVRDITEEKHLKENFQQNMNDLQDFLDNATELIERCDDSGKFIYVNNAWCRKLGYKRSEALKMTFKDIVHPDFLKESQKILNDVKNGKTIRNYEMCFITKKGKELPIIANINGRFQNDIFISTRGIFTDISEQKRAIKEHERRSEELKNSNEQLEQFVYIVSHDLQEPLRMVASYLQLLKRRYQDKLGEDANDFIAYAVNGAERMSAMIKALLQYSRIETRGRAFSPVDANKALKVVITSLDLLIKDHDAEITSDNLPLVQADENQLQQVFQNLIINAIKYRGTTAPKIHISFTETNSHFQFAVKDNGTGIFPEEQERIFMIFQRLQNAKNIQGTGIGLSICKRIIERHGGNIWVESVPDNGSTFYFTLPQTIKMDIET